ncbi:MAG TPA: DUF1971 domain-containing protein [Pseudomonadales bacterium]|nr:DUF1971 domain-containing protein [Pseudomonadales bacterium]
MQTIPEQCEVYRSTPEFDETSIPAGLLGDHRTKAGTWGRIVVLAGRLHYHIVEPLPEHLLLEPGHDGVVEPTMLHRVEADGPVRFRVDFLRAETR